METKVRVHNPMGYPPQIAQKRLAPRPAELSGKTVYLVDCRFDDGDILVEQMANWFHDHRPDVKIEVRRKSGVYTERDEALYTEIQQEGAAAVVAVGH
ncbi:MAG: hypothetical protein DCC55_04850 [Chloroflexi bacterium]|nr:MAG: hypothetical protein DCC55_04850 [Chloroflexota bacterium]